jgi:RNA polymerase sigma-70 factor (ECF subfamily)
MERAVETWAGPGSFEEVLSDALGGDERAFTRLWRWAQPALVRWLSVVAPDSGEDLASDVWISVIRGLGSFEGGEHAFRAWFFTIARRRVIDASRYRRRRPSTVSLDGVDAPSPGDVLESVAGAQAVAGAIAYLRRLRPEQAEVVALRVIGGLSVSQVATVVGRSDAAVRVLCHRGLRTLAEHVGSDLVPQGSP